MSGRRRLAGAPRGACVHRGWGAGASTSAGAWRRRRRHATYAATALLDKFGGGRVTAFLPDLRGC
eukprot:3736210-Pleurochrysis_carterae.AAC.1